MAHLTLLIDGREVRKFALNKGVTTIGRAQDNDIVINNLALSRRHAQVEYKTGRYEVVDLQSQNGVFVNTERLRGSRPLEDRDSITLGTYQFIFRTGDEAAPKPRTPPASAPPRRAVEETQPEAEAPAKEEHVPLLVLKYNDVELQRTPVRSEICLIGRAKECDVQIPERRLSRKHCELKSSRGTWLLKDLGSQNGTYVNRRRIRGDYELKHGDILNFAEYSVLFLADSADYEGPDADRSAGPVTSDPAMVNGETVMPPAYSDDQGYREDSAIRPSDFEDPEGDDRPAPPVAMVPAGREPLIRSPQEERSRRKNVIRAIREKPAPERKSEPPPPARRSEAPKRRSEPPAEAAPPAGPRLVKPRPSAPPEVAARGARVEAVAPARRPEQRPRKLPADEMFDVPDDESPEARDPALDDWYQSRSEKSELFDAPDPSQGSDGEESEEASVLLARSPSSVSQVLSTMMVDKRELDRNLRGAKAKQRRFCVEVRHADRILYSGPLVQPVTILGTDREADIQLKGRYVAGRHSLLVKVRDSLLLVRLGSSSAARVNGLPKLQAFVKAGDVVQIDETTIQITED